MSSGTRTETATLAGGCFWCLEAVYKQLRGVNDAENGYAGGSVANPSYERVCSGTSGHAEVVRVSFDPDLISFKDLLDVFFTIHDPTTLNRQGVDIGSQYRSAVFYESPEQRIAAERKLKELERDRTWPRPIVTEIVPLQQFWPAGDYHRDYFVKHPDQAYCRMVVEPKVAKFRKAHFDRLRRA